MREIKFRAWDRKFNKWIDGGYGFHILGESIHLGGLFSGYFRKLSDGRLSDIIITQYTGLKDKNGNEIYDGDVVGVHDDEMQGKIISRVSWHEKLGAWWLDGQYQFKEYLYEFDDSISLEIIGNIYENSELLLNQKEK